MQHKRGIPLGHPFGVPVLLHASWLPAAGLLVAHLVVTVLGAYGLVAATALAAAAAAGVMASVLGQELVQAWTALARGRKLAGITLYPFGGIPRYKREADHAGEEVLVALSGPLTSGVLGVALYLASGRLSPPVSSVLWTLGVANITLAAVNLVPGLPFDGGRMMRDALWRPSGNRYQATRTAARVGQMTGIVLLAAGTAAFAIDPSEQLGGAALWAAVLGLLAVSLASSELRAEAVVTTLGRGTAGEWARPFSARVDLDDVVPDGDGPFAVSDDGRLAGIIPRAAPGRVARNVMVPWRRELSCAVGDPIAGALERLGSARGGVVVVLDERGVVRGVLSREGVRSRLGGVH